MIEIAISAHHEAVLENGAGSIYGNSGLIVNFCSAGNAQTVPAMALARMPTVNLRKSETIIRIEFNNGREPKERAIMKKKAYTTILAVIALMLFSAVGALAQTEHQHGAQKPMQYDMSKMDMSSMMNEPHHALAMAYMQNIATFAKTLHKQAEGSSPLNAEFARAAVTEMRRSFDQMKQHHQEHVQTMSAEMHTKMSGMMQQMETHQAELNTKLTALEQEVQSATPDAKKVSTLTTSVYTHLGAMSKMHQGSQGSKMKMKM
jgi:polyhydroxyalkanoate synthesis regulator phasin